MDHQLAPSSSSPPTTSHPRRLSMKAKVHCTCTKCVKKIFYQDGEEFSGQLVTEKTRKKHTDADAWREEAITNTILLAAASQPISRQASMTLPVRRRDSERQASSSSTLGENVEVVSILCGYSLSH